MSDSSSGSSSTSDITNAASASTSTFVTALVFNAIVFGAELGVFTLVRPYFPAIYQPRTYVPPEPKRIGQLTRSFYSWPLAVFKADYKRIKDINGLDAYFYVRFLRMMTRILLPIWFFSWIILLPLVAVNSEVDGRTGLDKLSFGNVATNKQTRYAGHLILAWLFTFWVWYNIKHEMTHFIHVRQHWLISEEYATSAQASTVLIRGVPQRYLSERALMRLFEHLPGGVAKVWLNRDLKEMPDVYERRLKACAKLESAETSLFNTAAKLHNKKLKQAKKQGKDVSELSSDKEQNLSLAETLVPKEKRPTHRLPAGFLPFSLPLIGQKVDSIEWARKEIAETSALLREQRITLAKDVATTSAEEAGLPPAQMNHPDRLRPSHEVSQSQTYPPYNSAFVLFNKQIAAHMAGQLLTHHEPYRMADRHLGVSPKDVIWANLNMNPYEARLRSAVSWGITLGLIILWSFPVAFVGAVSNIHSLCTTYHWLAWLCNLPSIVVGIISGILPPVLLAVLMMLLPIVLRILSRLEGTPTRADIELSLMTRYFIFQILHSFLIVTLSSGIIAALPDLVNNPGSIPSLLAQNLPKASNFFLTYIILQGLSGTASGFLQVVPLVLYYVKLFILGSTPRSIYNIKYTLRNVAWGTLWPGTTLIVAITLAYSIISPVINGLACFTFFCYYHLWKYLFLWQLDQPASGETGGLFFPKAIQHMFVGMYIQQICLAALFFLARNDQGNASSVAQGALMIVLIAFTGFFNIIINNSYGPLLHSLPLSLADKSHTWSITDRDEGLRNSVDTVDSQPPMEKARTSKGKETVDGDQVPLNPMKGASSAHEGDGQTSPSASNPEDDTASIIPESQKAPPSIKAVDEDAGPKEFYHPASVEPQRIVWLPKDTLGLAEEEERAIKEAGILVSLDDAIMDEKGHVDISGPPPGGEVRTL